MAKGNFCHWRGHVESGLGGSPHGFAALASVRRALGSTSLMGTIPASKSKALYRKRILESSALCQEPLSEKAWEYWGPCPSPKEKVEAALGQRAGWA